MLVLTGRPGEKILIGKSVIVTVLEASKNRVRLGISAPEDVPVLREKLSFSTSVETENVDPSSSVDMLRRIYAEPSEVFLG